MYFKGFVMTFLILVIFSTTINASFVEITKGNFSIRLNTYEWINSNPVSAGFNKNNWSLHYTYLWSEVLSSKGHGIAIEYKHHNLIGKITAKYFPRANQGGYTIFAGIEHQLTQYLSFRLGLKKGWLTGDIKPWLSLIARVDM